TAREATTRVSTPSGRPAPRAALPWVNATSRRLARAQRALALLTGSPRARRLARAGRRLEGATTTPPITAREATTRVSTPSGRPAPRAALPRVNATSRRLVRAQRVLALSTGSLRAR